MQKKNQLLVSTGYSFMAKQRKETENRASCSIDWEA